MVYKIYGLLIQNKQRNFYYTNNYNLIMEIDYLFAIKVVSMIVMFLMIIVMGNIPLRSAAFKGNQLLLELTGAFSGGLFLSVGIIHLLPESMK